jgi:uncharacterized protein (TIGR02266 family)
MFSLASKETYQGGQVIFEEGSTGNSIYVILSGSVEISKMVRGKKFTVELLRQGETFGELIYLGDMKRDVTATAIGETILGLIDRDLIDQEFNRLSSDFRSIHSALLGRFKKLINTAFELSARGEPRIQKILVVTYNDSQSFVKAYTKNISAGWLLILTDHPLDQGEKFLLNLQLPGLSEPISIKSAVAWAKREEKGNHEKPAVMGVEFLEMSKNDKESLKQYIAKIRLLS